MSVLIWLFYYVFNLAWIITLIFLVKGINKKSKEQSGKFLAWFILINTILIIANFIVMKS